jgi:hypothetical protein
VNHILKLSTLYLYIALVALLYILRTNTSLKMAKKGDRNVQDDYDYNVINLYILYALVDFILTLPHCHFVHHKSQMNWTATKLVTPR